MMHAPFLFSVRQRTGLNQLSVARMNHLLITTHSLK